MTAPRQVLPGTTYLVTRRCSQRQFLLRPSKRTNQIFGYLLAIAATRFRIEVHAFCVMSNHVHLVVTDTDARLPAFSQFLDSLVARTMNALLARWEHFWGPSSYSVRCRRQGRLRPGESRGSRAGPARPAVAGLLVRSGTDGR
jgi:putative transposase